MLSWSSLSHCPGCPHCVVLIHVPVLIVLVLILVFPAPVPIILVFSAPIPIVLSWSSLPSSSHCRVMLVCSCSHPGHVVLSWSLSSLLLSWSSMSLLSSSCCPGPCSHPRCVDLVLVLPVPVILIASSCPGPCCPCCVVLTWSLLSLLYCPIPILVVLTWSWSSPSLSSSSCCPVGVV